MLLPFDLDLDSLLLDLNTFIWIMNEKKKVHLEKSSRAQSLLKRIDLNLVLFFKRSALSFSYFNQIVSSGLIVMKHAKCIVLLSFSFRGHQSMFAYINFCALFIFLLLSPSSSISLAPFSTPSCYPPPPFSFCSFSRLSSFLSLAVKR